MPVAAKTERSLRSGMSSLSGAEADRLLLQFSTQGGIGDPGAWAGVIAFLGAACCVRQAVVKRLNETSFSYERLLALVCLFALDPVPMAPAELGRRTAVSRIAMGSLLKGLEGQGWIRRFRTRGRTGPHVVELTDLGREEAGLLIRRFLQAASQIGSALSLSERSGLVAECRLVSEKAALLF